MDSEPDKMIAQMEGGICSNPEGVTHNLETIQEFQCWRRKIKPLFNILARIPKTNLEVEICANENEIKADNRLLKDFSLISKCQALHEELIEEVNIKRKDAKEKWTQIQNLWKELEEKEEFQLTFTYGESGVMCALDELISQLGLRYKDKSLRIEEFIKELRNEISVIWDQCMITEDEKSVFKEFTIDEYTEEMLNIHTEELKKWQIYHKKNLEILSKIKKRDEMWIKLRDLETRADDPNRFVNRGGALLKDQNMHNHITKNLPKLESELINLSEKFEKEHGRKMKILGKEIPIMIEEEWKKFKAEKAEKKQAKVNQVTTITSTAAASATKATLRSRQSIMPGSSSRPLEKRPATRLETVNNSPLKKCPKFSSVESIKSNNSDKL